MMAAAFCPRCGEPRLATFQFCRKCGLDFDNPVEGVVASPVPSQPATQWVLPSATPKPALIELVHLREDLRNLPDLVTQGYSVMLPALLILFVFALFEVSGGNISEQSLQALGFNLFIFPPPWASALIAGLLTRRSGYLAGGIVSTLAAIVFTIWVMTATFAPSSAGVVVTTDVRLQNAVYAIVISLVTGVLLGSFGAFCRRLGERIFNP